jgi:hypothetical protein
MESNRILFCSSKGVPHLALIAHLYGLDLELDSKHKPKICDERFTAATYFNQRIKIKQPIVGHLTKQESAHYRDFIIQNASMEFNQINYSELLTNEDFEDLKSKFTIIQLLIPHRYHRQVILNRIFRLYQHIQSDYVLTDQCLFDHHSSSDETRLKTYMNAVHWKDDSDVKGFIKFLLSEESPASRSLHYEYEIKSSRKSLKLSYGNLFDQTYDYEILSSITCKHHSQEKWKDLIEDLKIPDHLFAFGQYWELSKI